MKTYISVRICGAVVALFLLSKSMVAGAPSFTDLGLDDFWDATGQPTQEIEATVAASSTLLYVASSWWNGTKYIQISKWNNGTWSIVTNSQITHITLIPMVTALAIHGNDLYIGGRFNSINYLDADNLAKLNVSTGAIMAETSGLTGPQQPKALRVATWGGGSYGYGTRTYLYVGSPGTFLLNGTSCNGIGRTYHNGTSWVTDTMQSGVTSTVASSSKGVYGVDINPVHSWDSTYGYRHAVYVSGEFNRAAGGSTYATNVAIWYENNAQYSIGWVGVGTGGQGLSGQSLDGSCQVEIGFTRPWASVWSQGAYFGPSAFEIYYTGNFNRVNGSLCYQSDGGCGFYSPIDLAKYGSGSGLGKLSTFSLLDYQGSYVPPNDSTRIAANSSGLFLTGNHGVIVQSGCTYPSTGSVAAAYHIYGSTVVAIGGTASVGNHAPVYFSDVVTTAGAAFFTREQVYPDGPIWKYVP